MLLRPTYKTAGMLAFPYFFFLEMLGPVIESLGYLSCALTMLARRADWYFVGAFLAVTVVFGRVLSLSSVALEELSFRRYPRLTDLLRLFGLAALENVGDRQLNTCWRVQDTYSAIRDVQGWGKMTRKGFGGAST